MPSYLSANKETLGIPGIPLIQPGFSVLRISDLEKNWSQKDKRVESLFFLEYQSVHWHQCVVTTVKIHFLTPVTCVWIKNMSVSTYSCRTKLSFSISLCTSVFTVRQTFRKFTTALLSTFRNNSSHWVQQKMLHDFPAPKIEESRGLVENKKLFVLHSHKRAHGAFSSSISLVILAKLLIFFH